MREGKEGRQGREGREAVGKRRIGREDKFNEERTKIRRELYERREKVKGKERAVKEERQGWKCDKE